MAREGERPRIEWVGEPPDPEFLARWCEAHQLVDDEELDAWRAEPEDTAPTAGH